MRNILFILGVMAGSILGQSLLSSSASAQTPAQIKLQCKSPNTAFFGTVTVQTDGNINAVPCPTKNFQINGINVVPVPGGFISGGGTAGYLPVFTAAQVVGNSPFQSTTSSATFGGWTTDTNRGFGQWNVGANYYNRFGNAYTYLEINTNGGVGYSTLYGRNAAGTASASINANYLGYVSGNFSTGLLLSGTTNSNSYSLNDSTGVHDFKVTNDFNVRNFSNNTVLQLTSMGTATPSMTLCLSVTCNNLTSNATNTYKRTSYFELTNLANTRSYMIMNNGTGDLSHRFWGQYSVSNQTTPGNSITMPSAGGLTSLFTGTASFTGNTNLNSFSINDTLGNISSDFKGQYNVTGNASGAFFRVTDTGGIVTGGAMLLSTPRTIQLYGQQTGSNYVKADDDVATLTLGDTGVNIVNQTSNTATIKANSLTLTNKNGTGNYLFGDNSANTVTLGHGASTLVQNTSTGNTTATFGGDYLLTNSTTANNSLTMPQAGGATFNFNGGNFNLQRNALTTHRIQLTNAGATNIDSTGAFTITNSTTANNNITLPSAGGATWNFAGGDLAIRRNALTTHGLYLTNAGATTLNATGQLQLANSTTAGNTFTLPSAGGLTSAFTGLAQFNGSNGNYFRLNDGTYDISTKLNIIGGSTGTGPTGQILLTNGNGSRFFKMYEDDGVVGVSYSELNNTNNYIRGQNTQITDVANADTYLTADDSTRTVTVGSGNNSVSTSLATGNTTRSFTGQYQLNNVTTANNSLTLPSAGGATFLFNGGDFNLQRNALTTHRIQLTNAGATNIDTTGQFQINNATTANNNITLPSAGGATWNFAGGDLAIRRNALTTHGLYLTNAGATTLNATGGTVVSGTTSVNLRIGASRVIANDATTTTVGLKSLASGYPTVVEGTTLTDVSDDYSLKNSALSATFLTMSNTSNAVTIGNTATTGTTSVNNAFYISYSASVPATATTACTKGEIRYDASYIYICTATNTWRRAAIAAW